MAPHPEPIFLDLAPGPLGQRFALHHTPHGLLTRGLVVYVHPFGEEMNKSRRMAALQSRALAAEGFALLQMDLLGCGDSGGDFGDATWAQWVDDVVHACRWLQQRHAPPAGQAAAPLWLWGLRAGCLLAADALAKLDAHVHLLLMQPPPSGKALLQQFLRLKLAGNMADGSSKGMMAELRAAFARGESVEIAGYSMGAALASGLESATLVPPMPAGAESRLVWLELSSRPSVDWTPAALQSQKHWRDAGYEVSAELVNGPAFWQTTEIEEAPALVDVTCRLLTSTAQACVPPAAASHPLAA